MNEQHRRSTKYVSLSHHKPRPVSRNTSQLSLFYCHPVADLCHCGTRTWLLLEICVSLVPSRAPQGAASPGRRVPPSGSKAEHHQS